jgi:hypothetical protein
MKLNNLLFYAVIALVVYWLYTHYNSSSVSSENFRQPSSWPSFLDKQSKIDYYNSRDVYGNKVMGATEWQEGGNEGHRWYKEDWPNDDLAHTMNWQPTLKPQQ